MLALWVLVVPLFFITTRYVLLAYACLASVIIFALKPELGFCLFLMAIPFWGIPLTSYGRRMPDLRPQDVFFLLGTSGFLLRMVLSGELRYRRSRFETLLALLIAYWFLNLFWVEYLGRYSVQLAKHLYGVAIFLMVIQVLDTKEKILKGMKFWIVGMGVVGIIALVEFSQIRLPKILTVGATAQQLTYFGAFRTRGFAASPNFFGASLRYVILILSAVLMLERRSGRRAFYIGVLLLLVFLVITTLSRGSYLGHLAAIVVAFVACRRWRKAILIGTASFTGLILILYIASYLFNITSISAFYNVVGQRLATYLHSPEVEVPNRLRAWSTSLQIFLDHPVTGVGIGNWMFLGEEYGFQKFTYPHSMYVILLSEQGLIGMALVFLVIAGLWYHLLNALRISDESRRPLCVAFLAMLGGYLVQAMFHNFGFYEIEFWTAMGMGISLALNLREEKYEKIVVDDRHNRSNRRRLS